MECDGCVAQNRIRQIHSSPSVTCMNIIAGGGEKTTIYIYDFIAQKSRGKQLKLTQKFTDH